MATPTRTISGSVLAQLDRIDTASRRIHAHLEEARVIPNIPRGLWDEFERALFVGDDPDSSVVAIDGWRGRPPFEDIYMSMATLVSKRSTCARLKVGCVITSADYRYVYGIGYNGNAQGLPNKCDSTEVGNCGCVHAEANAVINCNAPRDARKIVFCTTLPCVNCAKYLVNLGGVGTVYYKDEYRLKDAIGILSVGGIACRQLG